MARLWERMGATYGHKWESAHGTEDDGTWLAGLYGVTPEQVSHGLAGCALRDNPWPPSLPEFRAMCLGGGERYDRTDGAQVAARMPSGRELPAPGETWVERRERGNAALDAIFAKMGRKRKHGGGDA